MRRGHTEADAAAPGDDRAGACRVGQVEPDVPPGVHVALHSGRHARAAAVVQRPVPQDDDRRGLLDAARRRAAAWTSSSLLGEVRTPTLVLHARDDEVIPVAEGRLMAGGIPGAEFVELDSRNHILLEHEPAWQRFREAVLAFVQPGDRRRGFGVRGVVGPRARGAGADGRRLEQHRHRRAAEHQREDRPQSRVEPLRQARRLVARSGDRLRPRSRFSRLGRTGIAFAHGAAANSHGRSESHGRAVTRTCTVIGFGNGKQHWRTRPYA